jgi:hypothetical protein
MLPARHSGGIVTAREPPIKRERQSPSRVIRASDS